MQILITGGLGFIGSNFIRLLLEKMDFKVLNLDKLTYAENPENLRDLEGNSRYSFVKGDICDRATVDLLVSDCDAIVNFAAETHVDRSIQDDDAFLHTNILGTRSLLEAAKKHRLEAFIQISTDEVYGSATLGSFAEIAPLRPGNPYSASKGAADLLALSYHNTHGLPIIITRSSNNFGPRQYPEKLFPLFITNLLEGKKVPVYGDGLNIRDWIYVVDNCEAILFVLENGEPGEIYNIGADNERTNMEITRALLQQLGKDESSIEFVEDRKGHDKCYSLNCNKINSLGWKPRFAFEEALEETVRWFRGNPKWWEAIKSGKFREYYEKTYGGRKK